VDQPRPGDSIMIVNEVSDAVLQWRVTYDGGESDLTSETEIQLSACPGLAVGDQCWPLIEPVGGTNHQCGGVNVAYQPGAGTRSYMITGTVDDISCDGPN
jgi:hypothetical protein